MTTDHGAWLAQVSEAALEPELPICDAHHHLWLDNGHTGFPYTLADLHADASPDGPTRHNVVRTVFLECGAEYHTSGPEHLRPVGETVFVAATAEESRGTGRAEIAAIVSSADVVLGGAVEEVLAAHDAAGQGLFRGVRYIVAQDESKGLRMSSPDGVMQDPAFLTGVRTVGRMGYSFDTMVYHPQIPELIAVARACPEVTIVANHLCAPLGVGPYRDRRAEILAWWRERMTELAACPNVVLKVGGIGMPMMGLRWDRQEVPPTSEELAAPWRDELRHVIDAFGPSRAMFESNFPVDKLCVGYTVLWNAFKRIASGYSAAEKADLFHDTAARTYRIATVA